MKPDNYEWQTTFWSDYKIATAFGAFGIKDTYSRSMKEWSGNVVYMKELAFVLNIFCWDLYHAGWMELSKLYSDLYYDCYDKCVNHFKDAELREFLDFID